jgi:hypothetical protein
MAAALSASVPYAGPERRKDAGYQQRLLDETHAAAMDIRKRLFEGNGDPPIVVQIANLRTCQDQQGRDLNEMDQRHGGAIKELRDLVETNTKAILAMQGTLNLIVGAWKYVGAGLLVALILAVLTLLWNLITHQQIILTPTPIP